jgi:uncharacterized protein (DUF305 family)
VKKNMSDVKRPLFRPLHRHLAVAGAVVAGCLLVAACGSDGTAGTKDGKSGSAASQIATTSPAPDIFNGADVRFAQMMIPRHQQAVKMAKLAQDRASDQKVKDLAAAIEKTRSPEIETMRAWLKSWGKPQSPSNSTPGVDGASGRSGMMSDRDMKDLAAARGTDFDHKFADMMTAHHNGATTMVKDEWYDGRNPAARKLADAIMKTHVAEIKQLQEVA